MPTLYRDKRDGGYFIRTFRGTYMTYQVFPDGEVWLREHGVDLDAKQWPVEIGRDRFRALQAHGYLFTGGGGIPGRTLYNLLHAPATYGDNLDHTTPGISRDAVPPLPRLVLRDLGVQGWELAIAVPEIPRDLLPNGDARELTHTLSNWRLRVQSLDEERSLSAVLLWPGSGGAHLPVPLETSPHLLVMTGPWPTALQTGWGLEIAPVREPVTLFAGPAHGGARLFPNERVLAGRPYVILRRVHPAPRWLPAAEVLPQRSLGTIEGWEAVEITVPEAPPSEVEDWLTALGHPLVRMPWTIEIVSPFADRHSIAGVPILAPGEPILLALFPAQHRLAPSATPELRINRNGRALDLLKLPTEISKGSVQPGMPYYVAIPAPSPGTYQVFAFGGWVTPIQFLVADRLPLKIPATLHPLRIRIGTTTLTTFTDHRQADAHSSAMSVTLDRQMLDTVQEEDRAPLVEVGGGALSITLHLAVRVAEGGAAGDVTGGSPSPETSASARVGRALKSLANRGIPQTERHTATRDAAAALLTARIVAVLHTGLALEFTADAGPAFGRIHCVIMPARPVASSIPVTVPPPIPRLAWLLTAMQAAARRPGARLVPITHDLRRAIEALRPAVHPSCLTTQYAPVNFLPRLRAALSLTIAR